VVALSCHGLSIMNERLDKVQCQSERDSSGHVQVTHEKVREFLLNQQATGENLALQLQDNRYTIADGHELLKKCCLLQLCAVDDQFPEEFGKEASRI
jgi:hypothetical protein